MSDTRVGVNVFRWGGDVERALFALKPGLIVTGGQPDWPLLAALAHDGALVVYRQMTPGNEDNAGADPGELAQAALAAVEFVRGWFPPGGLAVQGYNERCGSAGLSEQLDRELAFVRAVQSEGIPVVALNASAGQVDGVIVPLMFDLWRESAAIGYHGYCRDGAVDLDPPESPWHLRRPEALWLPVLRNAGLDLSKLLLTETGTYYAPFRPSGEDGCPPADYARLLIAIHDYACGQGVGMLGTAGFVLAAEEPWRTTQPWELVGTEAVDVLAAYNASRRGAPIRLMIPTARAITLPAPANRSGSEATKEEEKGSMDDAPQFRAPVDVGAWPVTQLFGDNVAYYLEYGGHPGIDYGCWSGTPVMAPSAGAVALAGTDPAYPGRGLHVVIDHGGGWLSYLMHLSQVDAHSGETVAAGQQVGLSGNTGLSTEPHLHWGVRDMGHAADAHQGVTDPAALMAGSIEPEEDTPMDIPRFLASQDRAWEVKEALEAAGLADLAAKLFAAIVEAKVAVGVQPG